MAKRAGAETAEPNKKSRGEDGAAQVEGKVLEKGLIYFFYRPKLDVGTAKELADVHHLYILLAPGADETGAVEAAHKKRLLVVEHNRMPHVSSGPLPKARSVAWCHVDTVSHHFRKIAQVLNAETIGTLKDAKKHTVEPARAVAEGFYIIAEAHGHVHLAYTLAEPKTVGAVQDAFHIDTEASYILAVRNPISAPQRVEGSAKSFPPYLIELFETSPPSKEPREWIPLKPTDFLDHEGIELSLVGVAKNVELDLGSLGVDLKMMEAGGRPVLHEALRRELQMSAKGRRVVPLKTGEWA